MAQIVDYGYTKKTWDALADFIPNEIGRAALMGNMYAESKFIPYCKQGNVAPPWTPSENYTNAVINGTKSEYSFVNDEIGYSLPQWTWYTRKQSYYDLHKSSGLQIGSFELAIAHLRYELTGGYKSTLDVLINATDIRTASDYVLHNYEGPADQGTPVEELRADYGEQIYKLYAGSTPTESTYLIISPLSADLNDGDTLTINVRASEEWQYSLSKYVTIVSKTDNTLVVSVNSGGQKTNASITILLKNKPSYQSRVAINLNSYIPDPADEDKIYILPKNKKAVGGQVCNFRVIASGKWGYRLSTGLEYIANGDNFITVRVVRGTAIRACRITVFLLDNNSVIDTSIIRVLGGGTGVVANKMPFIFYLKPYYKKRKGGL